MSEATTKSQSKHAALAERIIGWVVAAAAPAVSPDGTQIVFHVSKVNMEKNKSSVQIWVVPADASKPPSWLQASAKTPPDVC